jgi:hypothetical protein
MQEKSPEFIPSNRMLQTARTQSSSSSHECSPSLNLAQFSQPYNLGNDQPIVQKILTEYLVNQCEFSEETCKS